MPLVKSLGLAAIVQLGLGLWLVATATAQNSASPPATIVVSVADAQMRALEDVEVRLISRGLATQTNWIGEAYFRAVPRGIYRVDVRKIGFAPTFADVNADAETVGVFIKLSAMVVTLDTLAVSSRRTSSFLEGYERRKAMGIGRFLEDTLLAREDTRSLPIVLATHFPGVKAVAIGAGRYTLLSTRSSGRMHAGTCDVDVYVDGARYNEDLEGIRPIDLAGAELYSYGAAPVEYRRASASCNILLLWLRH